MTVPNGKQANRKSITTEEAAAYRRVVSEFPTVCITVGLPDGRVIAEWVGSGISEICGYDVDEIEDDSDLWINIVHPDDRTRVLNSYRRLAEGEHVSEDYRIYRKDGQMRWVGETVARSETITDGLARSMRCIADITVAKSMIQRETGFKELVDETPAGVTVRDLTGRMTYCNKACAALYGFETSQQMIGTTFEDVMAPEFAKQFRQDVFPQMLQGAFSRDVHLVRRDGTAVDVTAVSNLFHDDEGRPLAIYSILTDITQLKQVEAAIRASEEFLRRRYDAISAGMIVGDPQGRIVYANNAAGDILNLPPEQMLAKTAYDAIWRFVREDGSPLPLDEFSPYVATRTGKPVRGAMTGVLCGQPEECRWILMNSEPILDPATGELTEVINTFVDITERKQAQQALAESEERYRSLVDNVDAIIFRLDPECDPIALAGRIEIRSGYTRDEIMENPAIWHECVHPEDRERVSLLYAEAAATGVPTEYEIRLINGRTGEMCWMRTQVTPRFDDTGRLAYFDGVTVEVTERVEAQQREAVRAARIAALADMSQAFTSPLDSQQILDVAIRTLREELDSLSLGVTFELTTGHLLHMSIFCPWECDVESLRQTMEPSHLRIADVFGVEDIKPESVTDMRSVSAAAARFADAAELGPAILAPVTAGEGAAGVIISARPPGQEFDQEELWFLTEVASYASTALSNAAVYSRQARIAETLQRTLMPASTDVGCLDVATLYSPAPGEVEVGGDFLDIFPLANDKVGLVLGDVSGKGVEAAIHTAEAKYMLRAFVHQDPDPGYVMSSLNEALCHYLPDETFITLVYFVIDAQQHAVSYVNAGHEIPLVLCRGENIVKEIKPSGPMLGVTRNATFDVGSVVLGPDDTLFCYTDGLTDVRTCVGRFGYERLRDAVAVAPAGDSKSTMDHVMDKVGAFSPCTQTDDQVIVVVRSLV